MLLCFYASHSVIALKFNDYKLKSEKLLSNKYKLIKNTQLLPYSHLQNETLMTFCPSIIVSEFKIFEFPKKEVQKFELYEIFKIILNTDFEGNKSKFNLINIFELNKFRTIWCIFTQNYITEMKLLRIKLAFTNTILLIFIKVI